MFVNRRRYPHRRRPHVDMLGPVLMTPTHIRFFRQKEQLLVLQNTAVEINGYVYKLTDLLGHGGQGAVYAADVDGTDEKYAVKLIIWEQDRLMTSELPKHRGAAVFFNEVEKMFKLQEKSEHIVKIIDVKIEPNDTFVLGWIVMELGDGDVSKLIQELAVKKAKSNANANIAGASYTHARDRKRVWRQLVKCVDVLHGENIVNTDLKPGNFITFGNRIKLSDLGMARHTDERHLYQGIGTKEYGAPEVIAPYNFTLRAQRSSPKADVWSLGVILYEMTYGVHPRILNTDPVPPGTYEYGNQHNAHPPRGKRLTRDPYLQDILYRTLQLNPDNRPNIKELKNHPYTKSSPLKFL